MKNHSLVTLGIINTLCLAGYYVHSQPGDQNPPKDPIRITSDSEFTVRQATNSYSFYQYKEHEKDL